MVCSETDGTTLTVRLLRTDVERLKTVAQEVRLPASTLARVVLMDYINRAEQERVQERQA